LGELTALLQVTVAVLREPTSNGERGGIRKRGREGKGEGDGKREIEREREIEKREGHGKGETGPLTQISGSAPGCGFDLTSRRKLYRNEYSRGRISIHTE